MSEEQVIAEHVATATAVRAACLQAAVSAYEQASMDGLCHEGAWEVALSAISALNVEELVRRNRISQEQPLSHDPH
jgi:hypothetical protein